MPGSRTLPHSRALPHAGTVPDAGAVSEAWALTNALPRAGLSGAMSNADTVSSAGAMRTGRAVAGDGLSGSVAIPGAVSGDGLAGVRLVLADGLQAGRGGAVQAGHVLPMLAGPARTRRTMTVPARAGRTRAVSTGARRTRAVPARAGRTRAVSTGDAGDAGCTGAGASGGTSVDVAAGGRCGAPARRELLRR